MCGLGAFVTCLNFYLSFIRYPLHRARGGTRETFQWMSGFPVVGSLLLWIGAAFLYQWPAIMWSAIILSLFDTGGIHWFIVVMLLQSLKKS